MHMSLGPFCGKMRTPGDRTRSTQTHWWCLHIKDHENPARQLFFKHLITHSAYTVFLKGKKRRRRHRKRAILNTFSMYVVKVPVLKNAYKNTYSHWLVKAEGTERQDGIMELEVGAWNSQIKLLKSWENGSPGKWPKERHTAERLAVDSRAIYSKTFVYYWPLYCNCQHSSASPKSRRHVCEP